MVAMMNALGVDAGQVVQAQVAQALAHPPGLAQPAVALAQPVALMQPQPQTAVPGQAQVLGQVVAVNTAGDNVGRSGTHAKDQKKAKEKKAAHAQYSEHNGCMRDILKLEVLEAHARGLTPSDGACSSTDVVKLDRHNRVT